MSLKVWALIKLFKSMGFDVCLVAEDAVNRERTLLFAHNMRMAEGLAYRVLADYMLAEAVVPKKKAAPPPPLRLH